MGWKSLIADVAAFDPKTDIKSAEKVEQYRVSKLAVYLPGNEYIPLECVSKIRVRESMMTTKGCCGLSIPVFKVILDYGAERPKGLMCEKEVNAGKLAGLIQKARPDLTIEN